MKQLHIAITGTTSGIGEAAAMAFLKMGHVLLAINRNAEKAQQWKSKMKAQFPKAEIHLFQTELSDPEEVKKTATEILSQFNKLDVLYHNAGGVFGKFELAACGAEKTFATNHLGTFCLSHKLFPLLQKSEAPRMVIVASAAHFMAKSNPEKWTNDSAYNGTVSYANSKLANVMFCISAAEKMRSAGVMVNAFNPGLVRTPIGFKNSRWYAKIIWAMITFLKGKTAEEGAAMGIELAVDERWKNCSGKYFSEHKMVEPSALAKDEEKRRKLWNLSKDICKINDPGW